MDKKKTKKTKRRANHGVETESWVWTKRNQLKMPREGERVERVERVEMFAGDGDAVGMDWKAAAVRLSRRSLLLPSARPDSERERVGRDDAALVPICGGHLVVCWLFAVCWLLFAGCWAVCLLRGVNATRRRIVEMKTKR
ncbi:hypothetical protein TRV_05610 [Trichophyton verrucosum HKI 0517]|uniref:Uncharacterized protein n=1 Tax=Trichophyton verrucosum (strain HKI 0517) TaxID=663202 RepID=D4DEP1_TRIVH|nr:uncharacterized protein TRV_05610 [Trichophyton verrucosum HKI 0517]EFE39681.1 hypothetical protein TRV_05610 [Trichophyton verrucosum HKI 0517]